MGFRTKHAREGVTEPHSRDLTKPNAQPMSDSTDRYAEIDRMLADLLLAYPPPDLDLDLDALRAENDRLLADLLADLNSTEKD